MKSKSSVDGLSQAEQLAILERVREYREMAAMGNADRFERMKEAQDFTIDPRMQWDSGLRVEQEDRGKVCLSIPLIRSQIKQLVGEVVQNPKDLTVYNVKGGLKVLADLITALVQHAVSDQHVNQQIIQWFDQGTTTGSSYMGVFLDWDSDPLNANLTIMRLNEFEVLPDPSCQVYDINTPKMGARFMIWEPWEDRDYIESHWPGALARYGVPGGGFGSQAGFVSRFFGAVSEGVQRLLHPQGASDIFDINKLRQPITHCWWPEYKEVTYFYDLRQGDEMDPMVLVNEDEEKLAKDAAKKYPGVYEVRHAVLPVLNHTICLGTEVLLEHKVDEFSLLQTGQMLYPIIGYHAHFNNGFVCGVAEDMIGPQKLVNWSRSWTVNVMKNQPNSGWLIQRDINGSAKWLEDHGGKDGIVIDLSKFGGLAEKIVPAPLPQLEQITQLGQEEIRRVSNIHPDEPEQNNGRQQESGRSRLARQQWQRSGVSPVLSNFDYSLILLGNFLVNVIRSMPIYSNREITEIVEEKKLLDPQLLAQTRQMVAAAMGEELPQPPEPPDVLVATSMQPNQVSVMKDQYTRHLAAYDQLMAGIDEKAKPMAIQALIDAMRNARRGRYQCRVALSPQAVTMRMRNLMELAEVNELLIASGYQPLPEKIVLESLDIAQRDEVLALRGYS